MRRKAFIDYKNITISVGPVTLQRPYLRLPRPVSGWLEKLYSCCRFLLLTNLRFWTKGNAGIWGKILLRPDTVIWKLQAVPSKISLACGELCQNQAIGFYKLPGGGSGSIFGGQAGVHEKRVTDHGNAAICQKA